MTATDPGTSDSATAAPRGASPGTDPAWARRSHWGPSQYLASVGAACVAMQAYVWVAWLLAGPTSVTSFRDEGSGSWYLARVSEGLLVVLLVLVGAWVVRGCLRERRLTFDAKLCIGGLLTYWCNCLENFVQPLFLYSRNWTNVTDWVQQVPFHQRAIGPMIDAPVFMIPLYTVGFLLVAMLINIPMRVARRRWPTISNARLIALALAAGVVFDMIFETPYYTLHAWAFPGAPHELSLYSGASRFPFAEYLIVGAIVFGGIASLRFFTDDRGRRVGERGLDRYSPAVRRAVSLLAITGFTNLMLLAISAIQVVLGAWADPYPQLPLHLNGQLCDPPGQHATAYGPCPGSPGYRVPLGSTNPDVQGPR
jgi:hypothetical protein